MACQCGLRHPGSEVEDFQGCIIGSGKEFGIVRAPGEISHGIMVRVLHGFDVIKIRSPVFYVTFLAA